MLLKPLCYFALLSILNMAYSKDEFKLDPLNQDCCLLSLKKTIEYADTFLTGLLKYIQSTSYNRHKTTTNTNTSSCETGKYEKSCLEIKQNHPESHSGVYEICPSLLKRPIKVVCDMLKEGGGWTLIQRRKENSIAQEIFYRTWDDYKNGFGDLNEEFWLGNDAIHALTNDGQETELLVELEDFESTFNYARYNSFSIDSECGRYRLNISCYTGTAGDAMKYHQSSDFHTFDRTHPAAKDGNGLCVEVYKGGWWYGYNGCHQANPNGQYLRGKTSTFANGVNWSTLRGFYYSFKTVEMKVRSKQPKKLETEL